MVVVVVVLLLLLLLLLTCWRVRACGVCAQGTFGQVVSCWCDEMERNVAVKVIKNQPAYFHQVRACEGACGEGLHSDRTSQRKLACIACPAQRRRRALPLVSPSEGLRLFSFPSHVHVCRCPVQACVEIGLLNLPPHALRPP